MSIARRIRWVLLFAMLIGGVAWLVYCLVGLSRSADQFGNIVIRHEWSESRPSSMPVRASLLATQEELGRQVMTAVALVAFTLVMMFVHAFLHDPRKDRKR